MKLQEIWYNTYDDESVSTLLLEIFSKLKYLNSCSIDVCPLSRQVVETTDTNGIHLNHLSFLVCSSDSFADTLKSMKSSTSISAVSSLAFICDFETAAPLAYDLAPLFSLLNHLTVLDIDCGYNLADLKTTLFISVLQQQTIIETLSFRLLETDTGENNALEIQLPAVKTCSIKSIKLSLGGIGLNQDAIRKMTYARFRITIMPAFGKNLSALF